MFWYKDPTWPVFTCDAFFFVSDIYILHNDIKNLHMLNKNGNKLNQLYASICFLFHCTFLVEQSVLQLLGYFC